MTRKDGRAPRASQLNARRRKALTIRLHARFHAMSRAFSTVQAAAIWLSVIAAAWLLWEARIGLLLALGSVLAAMLLQLVSRFICRWTHLRDGAGLALAVLSIVILFLACAWLFGARLTEQFGQIIPRIETGMHHLGPLQPLASSASTLAGSFVPAVLSSGLAILEFLVIVAVAAIYIAAQPEMYRRGAVALFPRSMRAEADEALKSVAVSLQYWLLGQLITMAIVGSMSYCAMLLLGLPNPIALALIAGVAEIVPYLGPFIGAIPAVLVALTIGIAPALWTIGVYTGIHVFEGYLIAPLLQRRFVHIPPALILMSILFSQLVFGAAGVAFAAPIAVLIYTVVRLLYVRDTLNERVELPKAIQF